MPVPKQRQPLPSTPVLPPDRSGRPGSNVTPPNLPKQRKPAPEWPPQHIKDADEFARRVNDDGGASYHLSTMKFLNAGGGGDRGYMVGGHPVRGVQTPEVTTQGKMTPAQAHAHITRSMINVHTDAQDPRRVGIADNHANAYAGGWLEDGNGVSDIATRIRAKEAAQRVGVDRDQRAIFDVGNAKDIELPKRGRRG